MPPVRIQHRHIPAYAFPLFPVRGKAHLGFLFHKIGGAEHAGAVICTGNAPKFGERFAEQHFPFNIDQRGKLRAPGFPQKIELIDQRTGICFRRLEQRL